MKKKLIRSILSATILILLVKIFNFYDQNWNFYLPPITHVITWQQLTWTTVTGDINSWSASIIYTKKLLQEPLEIKGDTLIEQDFPIITVKKPINNIKISFEVTFTDYFKKYFQSYVEADWYFFAFKFFIWTIDNWWFYEVFRNQNDGVSNSINWDLNGAKTWKEINNWYTRVIEWEQVKIAFPAGKYGYTYAYPKNYINSKVGQTLHIWWHLSSVKEMKWRNFTRINQITIEYEWDKDAIEVIQ